VELVAISLVRNEERFVRRALLNVAAVCDRVIAVDHLSEDRTASILRDLSRELDHLVVRRTGRASESHELIEPYVGTDTWVLSVDGDELYDPVGLVRMRAALERGEHDDVFRVRPAGLHCDVLDETDGTARGYLSPPSRPLLGLFNLRALRSWSNVRGERLHGGDPAFVPGYDNDSWRHLGADEGWDDTSFRCLHVCFLRRSSLDDDDAAEGRPNLNETGAYRRDVRGRLEAAARRALRNPGRAESRELSWKSEKYRRGERVTVSMSPFLAHVPT
jgi:glycosyltransferase involved in cell wall biosynthesis